MENLTWRDFPQFYNNPVIQKLAILENWTVSDKNKRPIDMRAFIDKQELWGAAFDRGYNPLVDLKTLCDAIPNATNNAYYLDAERDGIVILDIEPSCPDNIKELFMGLPYLYGEVSMSGRGIHLIFNLPRMILARYPNAQQKLALKEEHGYYEILMNHMVTFTRNTLPPAEFKNDISIFENVFELLAQQATKTIKAEQLDASSLDVEAIPYARTIINVLMGQNYYKHLSDFKFDNSKYEYNMAFFYNQRLERMIGKEWTFKDHTYTAEERAVMIYEIVKQKIDHRAKHDSFRNGMPWLLYITSTMIAKTDLYNATSHHLDSQISDSSNSDSCAPEPNKDDDKAKGFLPVDEKGLPLTDPFGNPLPKKGGG